MLIERLTFRAKFGQGDAVVAAFQDWRRRFGERFDAPMRILVDTTGPMFTVVVESEFRDLAHLAESQAREEAAYAEPAFQEWFAGWSQLTEAGTRELFRVVE